MSGVVDLRVALETRLAAMVPAIDTQYENMVYLPVSGTPYQQVFLLCATPVNLEMGRLYQDNGYLQVSLRYPLNVGPGIVASRAQAVRDWFYRGLTLTANGLSVTINATPTIIPSIIDGDRHVVSVKIPFFANNVS